MCYIFLFLIYCQLMLSHQLHAEDKIFSQLKNNESSFLSIYTDPLNSRVNIGNNCEEVLIKHYNLNPEATGLEHILERLNHPQYVHCIEALFSFDSILSLDFALPNQREKINTICNQLNLWMDIAEHTQICNLIVPKITYHQRFQAEATSFDGSVYTDKKKQEHLFQFYSSSYNSRLCLNAIVAKRIIEFPSQKKLLLPGEIKAQSVNLQQPSFESIMYNNIDGSSFPPVILQALRKKKIKSEPKFNKNFNLQKLFFSPNDSKHRIHKSILAGVLTDTLLGEIIQTSTSFNLKQLIENFGIQVVYLHNTRDTTIITPIRAGGLHTGLEYLSNRDQPGFSHLDIEDLDEFINNRRTNPLYTRNTPSERRQYPLCSFSQILVISPNIDILENNKPYLHMGLRHAIQLALRPEKSQVSSITYPSEESFSTPQKLLHPPHSSINLKSSSTENTPININTIQSVPIDFSSKKNFFNSLKLNGITTLYIDTVKDWIFSPPNGIQIIRRKEPGEFNQHTGYITNVQSRYNKFKKRLKIILYECTFDALKTTSFPQCLSESPPVPQHRREIARRTIADILNKYGGQSAAIANALVRGGLSGITFKTAQESTPFWMSVGQHLRPLGIPIVPYNERSDNINKKIILVVPETSVSDTMYYFCVTEANNKPHLIDIGFQPQLTEGIKWKERHSGSKMNKAEELFATSTRNK